MSRGGFGRGKPWPGCLRGAGWQGHPLGPGGWQPAQLSGRHPVRGARRALSGRGIWQNELVGRWLKRELGGVRRKHCMGSLTGALPFPAFGSKVRARSRVDYQNTSEGALVQRAQAGEETAFREIVERYQSKVFSIIHGVVRQRNDVEDIAQQVFAKVYVSIKSFDFRSSLITWIRSEERRVGKECRSPGGAGEERK